MLAASAQGKAVSAAHALAAAKQQLATMAALSAGQPVTGKRSCNCDAKKGQPHADECTHAAQLQPLSNDADTASD